MQRYPWRRPREYTYEYEGFKFRIVLKPVTWEEKYVILAEMSIRNPDAVLGDSEEARKAAERIASGLSKIVLKVDYFDKDSWKELPVEPKLFLEILPDPVVDLIVRDVSRYLSGIDRKNLVKPIS